MTLRFWNERDRYQQTWFDATELDATLKNRPDVQNSSKIQINSSFIDIQNQGEEKIKFQLQTWDRQEGKVMVMPVFAGPHLTVMISVKDSTGKKKHLFIDPYGSEWNTPAAITGLKIEKNTYRIQSPTTIISHYGLEVLKDGYSCGDTVIAAAEVAASLTPDQIADMSADQFAELVSNRIENVYGGAEKMRQANIVLTMTPEEYQDNKDNVNTFVEKTIFTPATLKLIDTQFNTSFAKTAKQSQNSEELQVTDISEIQSNEHEVNASVEETNFAPATLELDTEKLEIIDFSEESNESNNIRDYGTIDISDTVVTKPNRAPGNSINSTMALLSTIASGIKNTVLTVIDAVLDTQFAVSGHKKRGQTSTAHPSSTSTSSALIQRSLVGASASEQNQNSRKMQSRISQGPTFSSPETELVNQDTSRYKNANEIFDAFIKLCDTENSEMQRGENAVSILKTFIECLNMESFTKLPLREPGKQSWNEFWQTNLFNKYKREDGRYVGGIYCANNLIMKLDKALSDAISSADKTDTIDNFCFLAQKYSENNKQQLAPAATPDDGNDTCDAASSYTSSSF